MSHVFRWSGTPLGFISGGSLFYPNSQYLGWIEQDGSVWGHDGQYIGELIDGEYIMRNMMRVPPIPRIPRIPPIPPIPLIPPIPRIPRIPMAGWEDPF
jgi:hypothetical protein